MAFRGASVEQCLAKLRNATEGVPYSVDYLFDLPTTASGAPL